MNRTAYVGFAALAGCAVGYGVIHRQSVAQLRSWPPKATLSPDTLLNQKLKDAVEKSDPAHVRALLAEGADADLIVSYGGARNSYPIAFIANRGDLSDQSRGRAVFDALIAKVKDVNQTEGSLNKSLLAEAIILHDLPAVQALIRRGANPNAHESAGLGSISVLSLALLEQLPRDKTISPFVTYLLDHGADPNARD